MQILGGEDNVSGPNKSPSLSLQYILPKCIPTVLLKSWFSPFKTFDALSDSRTSKAEFDVPTIYNASALSYFSF